MAQGIKIDGKLTGWNSIVRELNQLDRKIQRKLGLKAMRKGAKSMVKEAKNLAPKGRTGRLKRSIGLMAEKFKSGIIGLQLGARRGKTRNDSKGAWYAHFVEWGTVNMPGVHFLRKAVDRKSDDFVDNTGKELMNLIEKEV